jgi:hypothetical protein
VWQGALLGLLKKPRLLGALKVSVYLTFVSLCSLALSARAARGAVGEVALSVGRQLNEVSEFMASTKHVDLNGQPFGISTTVARMPVEALLERFAQACRAHPSELARVAASQGLKAFPDPGGKSKPEPSSRSKGEPLVHVKGENEGVLTCILDSGDGQKLPLAESISEFMRTRDASVFGDYLAVYARNQGKGKTHVIAVWTRGPFKILDLFPAEGDAPGSDSQLLGRPRNARRILSGSSGDQPYGVRVYESLESPERLAASFESDLSSRGWKRIADPGGPNRTVALQHTSGVLALIAVSAVGGKTALTLMEMGNSLPPRRSAEESP